MTPLDHTHRLIGRSTVFVKRLLKDSVVHELLVIEVTGIQALYSNSIDSTHSAIDRDKSVYRQPSTITHNGYNTERGQ